MEDFEGLQLGRADAVAVLRLNRPEQKNALNRALRDALVSTLAALAGDDTVKAVVLTGAGDTFCAGFDLKELQAGDAAEIFSDAGNYHRQLHTFPKPLVAAVNGAALAGGMDLASLCDLRLAAAAAVFGQPQVRFGVPAAFELTRSQMNEAMARRLVLTGDRISAEEALTSGYVSAVFPDARALEHAAMEWAGRIATSAASGAMKQQILSAQAVLFEPPR
ncbi:MAG: enoyl-CoA hydratase/isomerase family protein [Pseudomonadales bacterium]